LRHEVSEPMANGRFGIWRASIPAMAAAGFVRSLQRQSRPRLTWVRGRHLRTPAPFISLLLGIVIGLQTGTLPLPLIFLFTDANAKPMTEGCKKKTCCTALCYVDKHGVHHCVHMNGDSCECGLSSNEPDASPALPLTVGTLPMSERQVPRLLPNGWVSQTPSLLSTFDPATPSPPPK